uniref:Amino acid/amide ABC transporter substrate-binding protein, HAAT family n=1 Tax=Candidatus Kentrum sp. FW TaxID=2126338 RepID=A0A450S110_9GAMM|nr:MAG: amino acid/amide ABC transporter substrate-binding protein, HAAT family [Candidatus Kentron sp. FW]
MNKKQVSRLLIYLVVLAILVVILLVFYRYFYPSETIRIAVAGPMGGTHPTSIAIREGVRHKVDEVNAGGGIGGRKVIIEYFNDNDDRRRAIAVANEIAERDNILMVIGHKSSGASIAAGRIYRKAGIPAITASAMASTVTKDNKWYFRVISNTAFQGDYIANYISRALRQKLVSIVYDTGAYGSSLVKHFKISARKQGIEIVGSWGVPPDRGSPDTRLKTIVADLRTIEYPGMLFLATLNRDTMDLITLLRGTGSEIPIFVSYLTAADLKVLRQHPQEQKVPGFFSNGIYSSKPFLPDIANDKARELRRRILAEYGRDPMWHAYTYYDAVTTALKAIEHAEIRGRGHLRGDRKAIRTALTEFYSHEQGVPGTTGQIFFDENGDRNGHMATVTFHNRKQLPAYLQYQQTVIPIGSQDLFQDTLEGKHLLIGDKMMDGIQVVFVSVDVMAIQEIDFEGQHFTADFILRFRYKGEFDDTDIHFIDAAEPVLLGKPILEKTEDGVTTRSYRVSARFNAGFDFSDFPFERHRLTIRFVHNRLKRDKLVYATDPAGIREVEAGSKIQVSDAQWDVGWVVEKGDYFQDVTQAESTLGEPASFNSPQSLAYPRYNVELTMTRSGLESWLRPFLPLLILFILLYFQFFLSGKVHWLRLLFVIALLPSAICLHTSMPIVRMTEQPAAIEWAFYVFYVFVILALAEFNRTARRIRDNEKLGILMYVFSGISFFPLIMLVMIAFYANHYF